MVVSGSALLHSFADLRFSENSRRLWLSEIPCWKGFPANFDAAGKNDSPIFRQREMLSLPRFGHFPARKTAAGKLAARAGTLLA